MTDMKTIHPKKITKTAQQINKEAQEIIKKGKRKAGPVKVSDEEYRLEIKGKMVQRIHRQREYMGAILTADCTATKLVEMDRQLAGKEIKMQWLGSPMTHAMLQSERNLVLFKYKNEKTEINYKEQQLKKDGLSDKEIAQVAEGVYNKDQKKLDKLNEK